MGGILDRLREALSPITLTTTQTTSFTSTVTGADGVPRTTRTGRRTRTVRSWPFGRETVTELPLEEDEGA